MTVTSLQAKTPLSMQAERPILRPGEPIKGPALPGQNQAEKSRLWELVAVVLALQLRKAGSARARSGARGSKKWGEISHCYPGALKRPATFRKGPDAGPEKRPGQHPLNRAQRVRFAATLPAQAGRCGVLTFACWTARFGQQRGGDSVTVTDSAWPTGWARSRKRDAAPIQAATGRRVLWKQFARACRAIPHVSFKTTTAKETRAVAGIQGRRFPVTPILPFCDLARKARRAAV